MSRHKPNFTAPATTSELVIVESHIRAASITSSTGLPAAPGALSRGPFYFFFCFRYQSGRRKCSATISDRANRTAPILHIRKVQMREHNRNDLTFHEVAKTQNSPGRVHHGWSRPSSRILCPGVPLLSLFLPSTTKRMADVFGNDSDRADRAAPILKLRKTMQRTGKSPTASTRLLRSVTTLMFVTEVKHDPR